MTASTTVHCTWGCGTTWLLTGKSGTDGARMIARDMHQDVCDRRPRSPYHEGTRSVSVVLQFRDKVVWWGTYSESGLATMYPDRGFADYIRSESERATAWATGRNHDPVSGGYPPKGYIRTEVALVLDPETFR